MENLQFSSSPGALRIAVVVGNWINRPFAELIRELLPSDLPSSRELSIVNVQSDQIQASLPLLAQAEVVVGDPPILAPILDQLHSLKWFHSTYAGVNQIFKSSQKRDYILTRLSGYLGKPIAEYVIAQTISFERRFPELQEAQKEKKWLALPPYYRTLDQMTIGVLGVTGDIGSSIAKAAKKFGMKVHGYSKNPLKESAHHYCDQHFLGKETLVKFLDGVDFLVNALPSTHETSGMLGGDILSHCRSRTVFINVGRGDIIDEPSLLNALEKKWIHHAILDVFLHEPVPESSSLWSRKDITITPHISGLTFPDQIADSFVKNLQHYLKGEKLRHEVDFSKGY